MLPCGSSGLQLLAASLKPAPWGQFCSPVSCKKLRKGREKPKHPTSVASALLPLAACTALAPIPNQHISSTRSSSPAISTCMLPGKSIQHMLGTSPDLHSTSSSLSNL